jgi:hypothetical protein
MQVSNKMQLPVSIFTQCLFCKPNGQQLAQKKANSARDVLRNAPPFEQPGPRLTAPAVIELNVQRPNGNRSSPNFGEELNAFRLRPPADNRLR